MEEVALAVYKTMEPSMTGFYKKNQNYNSIYMHFIPSHQDLLKYSHVTILLYSC